MLGATDSPPRSLAHGGGHDATRRSRLGGRADCAARGHHHRPARTTRHQQENDRHAEASAAGCGWPGRACLSARRGRTRSSTAWRSPVQPPAVSSASPPPASFGSCARRRDDDDIHVAVPEGRRIDPLPGVVIKRTCTLPELRHRAPRRRHRRHLPTSHRVRCSLVARQRRPRVADRGRSPPPLLHRPDAAGSRTADVQSRATGKQALQGGPRQPRLDETPGGFGLRTAPRASPAEARFPSAPASVPARPRRRLGDPS